MTMEEEIWKDIEGFEGLYQVSNLGRVKSLEKTWICGKGGVRHQEEKILKPISDRRGYLFVNLSKDGKMKHFTVHRLVAEAFIPNPNNLPQVNHISQVKTCNRADLLEWCDAKYNSNYGTRNERIAEKMTNGKLSRQVYQYSLDGKLVAVYPSTAECGRQGFSFGNVAACCNGIRKTHKGFYWSYLAPFA